MVRATKAILLKVPCMMPPLPIAEIHLTQRWFMRKPVTATFYRIGGGNRPDKIGGDHHCVVGEIGMQSIE